MGLWKDVWKHFGRPSKHKGVDVDYNDLKMSWSIIKADMSYKEYKSRFRTFHAYFKHKFLIPVILVAERILGKYVIKRKDISKEEYNNLVLAFDEAFELSVREWCLLYRKGKAVDAANDYENDASVRAVRKIKDLLITSYMHDTAYRVLGDMVMLNLAVKIGEKYPGKIGQFIYNSKKIDDVEFRMVAGFTADHIVLDGGDHFMAFKKGDGIRIDKVSLSDAQKKVVEVVKE